MERNRDNFLVRLDFTSDPPKAASHLHSPSTWVLVPKQRPPAKRPSPLGEAHFAKGFYQCTAGPSKLTVLGWFVWTDASYQLCHENGTYGMFQMAYFILKKTWYHNIYIIYSMHSYDILFERYPGVISFKTGTAPVPWQLCGGWIRQLLMVDFQSLMIRTYTNS